MSGKTAKVIRKLAKKELEKAMQPNGQNTQTPPNRGIQIISSLEDFIQLCIALTGEKPTSLSLTEAMYNMYIQEAQRHGEILGLKTGFKTEEPTFLGVKLVRKSPLIVPTSNTPVPPVEPSGDTPEKTN